MRKHENIPEKETFYITHDTVMEALASFKKTVGCECKVKFVDHDTFAEVNYVKHGIQVFVRIPMGGWADPSIESVEKGVFDLCRHAWIAKLYN